MKGKKVLYVCSELSTYTPETELSVKALDLAKELNAQGAQIRVFMPRYGEINERRYQLHEVIRLSGMNLIVNDIDMPLIIKVASIPKERIQVYFIDNDEYFKRDGYFSDEKGLYPDNDERCIFFAKGVVETIKKLNWTPDVIHIQGWLGALLPLYLKTFYKDDPIFSHCKIILSVFNDEFVGNLDKTFKDKLNFDQIPQEISEKLAKPSFENLMKVAIENSDVYFLEDANVSKKILDSVKKEEKPTLELKDRENWEEHIEFYNKILENK